MQPFGPILNLFDAVADVCNTSFFVVFLFFFFVFLKTHTIFSIVKSGNQTRHITFNIKGSRCYYYHHHQKHHCNKHQLTAVSFVRTVATEDHAVTHIILGDTFPVLALPVQFGALPVGWTTNKVIAFSVTCKPIHRHCIRLSSIS